MSRFTSRTLAVAAAGLLAIGSTALTIDASAAEAPQTTLAQSSGFQARVWDLGGHGETLNVRSSASLSAPVTRTLKTGDPVTIVCQKQGPSVHNDVYGVSSTLWNYVPDQGGWVADAWIYTGRDGMVAPQCGTSSTPTPAPGKSLPVSDILEGDDWESQAFAVNYDCDMYAYATSVGLPPCVHPGVDRAAVVGTRTFSPVSGTVIIAGGTDFFLNDPSDKGKFLAGKGELRIRLDNGHEQIIGHMASISVTVGQRVSPGQLVGTSGYPTAPHIHVEYRVDGMAKNPYDYLG